MLSRSVSRITNKAKFSLRSLSASPAAPAERQFKYFDNLEIKDGVAIVRFNGPDKMNTISTNQREESGRLTLLNHVSTEVRCFINV